MAKMFGGNPQPVPIQQPAQALFGPTTRKNEWSDFYFRALHFDGKIYFEKIENGITVKNFTKDAPLSEIDLTQLRGNYNIRFGTESSVEDKFYWCEFGHQAIPEEKKPAPLDPEIEKKLREHAEMQARLALYEKSAPRLVDTQGGAYLQQPPPAPGVDMMRVMEMVNNQNRMWEERFNRVMERQLQPPQNDFNKEIMLALINKDTKPAEPAVNLEMKMIVDQLRNDLLALRSPQSDPLRDKMLDVMISRLDDDKNPMQKFMQMKNFLDEMKAGETPPPAEKESVVEKAWSVLPGVIENVATMYNQKAQVDIEKAKLEKQAEIERLRIEQENKQYDQQRKRETEVFERQVSGILNKTAKEKQVLTQSFNERLSASEQQAQEARRQVETYANTLNQIKRENLRIIRNEPPDSIDTPNDASTQQAPPVQGVFSDLLSRYIELIPAEILAEHEYQQLIAQMNDLAANPTSKRAHEEETIFAFIDFMIDIDDHYNGAITNYLEENKNPGAEILVVWARSELQIELPVLLVDKVIKEWYNLEEVEVPDEELTQENEAEIPNGELAAQAVS